ncbi:MAG: Gfo/Idh/MocA family oxidoreductase [Victivallales bacterium]|nr:Gfo/Idh/MocA family oxidoreductase [Victivallales bacterium]
MSTKQKIRIGVVGARRGRSFMQGANDLTGLELVAICDSWEERLLKTQKEFTDQGKDIAVYTDYERFLEHDMDAVVLANYFHEHGSFAIKALKAGLHVMSETMACRAPAEAVALVRAVEKSGKIYMLAENYPYFAYNQEMRRLYQAGEIGEMQYGEGEYNHPCGSEEINKLAPGMAHWRNWIPSTYYCTHALAPLMFISDTQPVKVNALSIARSEKDEEKLHVRRNDPGSVILCHMDNGAVVRIMGIMMRGHSVWYRLHGTRGLMENLRTGNQQMLRVVHEKWDMKEGDVREKIYLPEFPVHAGEAAKSGHGGGDFFMNYHFAEAIRNNIQPYFNVYRAVNMAMVSFQSWRSCLNNGSPFETPDLRQEPERSKYENDNFSPWPEDQGSEQAPPSIQGNIEPSEEAKKYARKVWTEQGWQEK